jgi:hypothetical protein
MDKDQKPSDSEHKMPARMVEILDKELIRLKLQVEILTTQ